MSDVRDSRFEPLSISYALLPEKEDKYSEEKMRLLARQIIKDYLEKTRPIDKSEYFIVALAFLFAASVASTGHAFSKTFISEALYIDSPVLEAGATTLSSTSQLLLSFRTNIERWSIIYRSLPDITLSDVRNNLFPMTVTTLSAIPTFKIAVDCKDFASSKALGYTIGSFRSASAIGFNSYFYTDHLQKKVQESKKNVPIIKILSEAKKEIGRIKFNKLIGALHTNKDRNFLKHFNDHQDPIEQTNSIINLLIRLAERQAKQEEAKAQQGSLFTNTTSWLFGFLSSMMNWKTASKVPELFNLNVAKDILHFISEVIENADPKLISAFIIGGAVIGLPAWYLNFLANRKACANAFDRFCKIREEGFKKHFWDKYEDNATMLKEWGLLFVTGIFSIGLGVANGGMAYRYPFLEYNAVRIINAITTGAVFMGLGFMSVDGFITTVEDKKDQKLLLNAFEADDLQKYYDSLGSDESKRRFVVLLKKYLQTIIDSLIGSFAKLNEDQLSGLLSKQTLEKLSFFSQPKLITTTPLEGDYVDIRKKSNPIDFKSPRAAEMAAANAAKEAKEVKDEDIVEHDFSPARDHASTVEPLTITAEPVTILDKDDEDDDDLVIIDLTSTPLSI